MRCSRIRGRRGSEPVILPRQGEVAPKVTEGADARRWHRILPLRPAAPATSPWRGRIRLVHSRQLVSILSTFLTIAAKSAAPAPPGTWAM